MDSNGNQWLLTKGTEANTKTISKPLLFNVCLESPKCLPSFSNQNLAGKFFKAFHKKKEVWQFAEEYAWSSLVKRLYFFCEMRIPQWRISMWTPQKTVIQSLQSVDLSEILNQRTRCTSWSI